MPSHFGECCDCVPAHRIERDKLHERIKELEDGNQKLETRRDELLVFIRQLSNDAHNPEEVAELRRWVGVLMAAVGTLRAKLEHSDGEPQLTMRHANRERRPARENDELPRCVYCGSAAVYTKDGSLDVKTVEEIDACATCGQYQEDGPPIPFGEL